MPHSGAGAPQPHGFGRGVHCGLQGAAGRGVHAGLLQRGAGFSKTCERASPIFSATSPNVGIPITKIFASITIKVYIIFFRKLVIYGAKIYIFFRNSKFSENFFIFYRQNVFQKVYFRPYLYY
jgi:hypothetical protein